MYVVRLIDRSIGISNLLARFVLVIYIYVNIYAIKQSYLLLGVIPACIGMIVKRVLAPKHPFFSCHSSCCEPPPKPHSFLVDNPPRRMVSSSGAKRSAHLVDILLVGWSPRHRVVSSSFPPSSFATPIMRHSLLRRSCRMIVVAHEKGGVLLVLPF